MTKAPIAIEKNVPMPDRQNGRGKFSQWDATLAAMEIGDSVGRLTEKEANTLASRGRDIFGFKMSQRKTDGIFRVWRIA
jgi:hypothetical protein